MPLLTLALILLLVSLILHLVEEIIFGFRKQFPLGEMPRSVFIGINVIIYLFAIVMIWLSYSGHPSSITMAWLFSIAMIVNGLGHLGIMILRKGYFPGGITAIFLIAVSLNVFYRLRCI